MENINYDSHSECDFDIKDDLERDNDFTQKEVSKIHFSSNSTFLNVAVEMSFVFAYLSYVISFISISIDFECKKNFVNFHIAFNMTCNSFECTG